MPQSTVLVRPKPADNRLANSASTTRAVRRCPSAHARNQRRLLARTRTTFHITTIIYTQPFCIKINQHTPRTSAACNCNLRKTSNSLHFRNLLSLRRFIFIQTRHLRHQCHFVYTLIRPLKPAVKTGSTVLHVLAAPPACPEASDLNNRPERCALRVSYILARTSLNGML